MHGMPKHARGLRALSLRQSRGTQGRPHRARRARHLRQPEPFHHQGRHPVRSARVRLRKPDGAQRRRAVQPLRTDRAIRRSARRPQLHHLPSATRGALLGRHAHHAGRRALQPSDPEGEGLALPSLALRQGGDRREDRAAQRPLHVLDRRRSRDPPHHGPAAGPAASPPDARDLRSHHAGSPGRQRALPDRADRSGPLRHLSPQSRTGGHATSA